MYVCITKGTESSLRMKEREGGPKESRRESHWDLAGEKSGAESGGREREESTSMKERFAPSQ